MDISLFQFKLISIVIVIIISFIGGFLPLRLQSVEESKRDAITEMSRYFTAGVFLGVSLLHMLPESAEGLESLGLDNLPGGLEFPLAYGVCALGVIILWFIERHVFSGEDKKKMVAVAAGAENRGGGSICYVKVRPVTSYGPIYCSECDCQHKNSDKNESSNQPILSSHTLLNQMPEDFVAISKDNMNTNSEINITCNEPLVHWNEANHENPNDTESKSIIQRHFHKAISHPWAAWTNVDSGKVEDACSALHEHSHSSEHKHIIMDGQGIMSLLLAALFSLHSFVVGAALGVESSILGASSLLIALLAHKGAEAFAVGVQFVQERVPLSKMILVMSFYCSMTPLGIILGMAALLLKGSLGTAISNLTQAFGAGSIIYIVMHILEKPCQNVNKWLQLFLFLFGLSIMAAVSIFS